MGVSTPPIKYYCHPFGHLALCVVMLYLLGEVEVKIITTTILLMAVLLFIY